MEAYAMSESDPRPFPVLDRASVEPRRGAAYPEHLRSPFAAREKRALGDPLGLTSSGVNLTRLPPGTASALRHWHSLEDEFVMVLEGEATLITEAGETVLRQGMAAGFPKGKEDGHQLVNRGKSDVVYLEVGDRRPGDDVAYPDEDLAALWRDGRRAHHRLIAPSACRGTPLPASHRCRPAASNRTPYPADQAKIALSTAAIAPNSPPQSSIRRRLRRPAHPQRKPPHRQIAIDGKLSPAPAGSFLGGFRTPALSARG
jgi:uncharacterized cupin superfamily protein